MAKTAAERAKEYRKRKRDGKCDSPVTKTSRDAIIERPIMTIERAAALNGIPNYGRANCECQHCQQNRRQGSKHILNHGPYKDITRLGPNEFNRVSLPGDTDYEHEGQA